jgi:hypothetical protein
MGAAVGASMSSSAKVGRRIANRGAHPMQPMRWLVDIIQPGGRRGTLMAERGNARSAAGRRKVVGRTASGGWTSYEVNRCMAV